jgi:hypothetical protein
LLPHALELVPAWQPPSAPQHPMAHDVESQTHCPSTQRVPPEHCGDVPQVQLPCALHPFAFAGSHALHCAPIAPHWLAVGDETQPPSAPQQPASHDAALQTQAPP